MHIKLIFISLLLSYFSLSSHIRTFLLSLFFQNSTSFTLSPTEKTELILTANLSSFSTQEDHYYFTAKFKNLISAGYCFSECEKRCGDLRLYETCDRTEENGEITEDFRIRKSTENERFLFLNFKFDADEKETEVIVESWEKGKKSYVWMSVFVVMVAVIVVGVLVFCCYFRRGSNGNNKRERKNAGEDSEKYAGYKREIYGDKLGSDKRDVKINGVLIVGNKQMNKEENIADNNIKDDFMGNRNINVSELKHIEIDSKTEINNNI